MGQVSGMARAKQRRNTRHKAKYLAYFNNDTRLKNKAYKLIKHIEKHPTCKASKKVLEALPAHCVRFANKKLKQARGEDRALAFGSHAVGFTNSK